jgi:UPF0755 protein
MSETLDPSKYHIFTGKKKRNLIMILVLIFLLVVPLLSFVYYQAGINRPSQTDKEITFEIKKGESVFTVAENLYAKDAINSKSLFILYVFINRLDKSIQAGVYTIKAGSTVVNITEQFMHGTNDVKVVFYEGWRVEEFAREAERLLSNVDYSKFIAASKPYEGYLFPDTYFFKKEATVEDLVSTLRSTFNTKTSDILTQENLGKVGLTEEQAVVLASIVEREVATDTDRQLVAGILLKRLRGGVKLDADATVQYAVAFEKSCGMAGSCSADSLVKDEKNIDWWPKSLSQEDLNVDSPYNTRKNLGLPPTPISSVSGSSLVAVMTPKNSGYYYYLNGTDGSTHYAKTLEEHSLNIQKYLTK